MVWTLRRRRSAAAQEPEETTATASSPPQTAPAAADAAPAAVPADTVVQGPESGDRPGFLERARLRRRLRFLQRTRELAYRDLGGLVFDLHRFGRRRDELVLAKLEALGQVDNELRAVQAALGRPGGITVLREAGVAPCPRCGAIHGSTDHFCPSCGLALQTTEAQAAAQQSTAVHSARILSPE